MVLGTSTQTDKRTEEEEGFRSALEDVVAIIQRLAPICKSINDMLGMVELALKNDSQCRLLFKEVMQGKE